MSTTYTIEVDETGADLKALNSSNYNLALAKAVATSKNGPGAFNTIFLSSTNTPNKKPTNQNQLTWTEQYGLNYTLTIPEAGAVLKGNGDWHAMSLGQGAILDTNGQWQNGTPGDSKALTAVNNYEAVNFIVGIQASDGSWNPIYYDPDQALMNVTGTFWPLEKIQLWWAEVGSTTTSSVMSAMSTPFENYTLQGTACQYFYYDTTAGTWATQTSPFPH